MLTFLPGITLFKDGDRRSDSFTALPHFLIGFSGVRSILIVTFWSAA
jgi:hypothetical protein